MLPKIINLLAIEQKIGYNGDANHTNIIYNQNKNCTQILINILGKKQI